MAENRRFKELTADVRRLQEEMQKTNSEIHNELNQAEVRNQQRFERMDLAIEDTTENLSKITMMLEQIQRAAMMSPGSHSAGAAKLKALQGDPIPSHNAPFQTLQRHQLYARLSKCSFGLLEVDYLGHSVWSWSINGRRQSAECQRLRGFLGLTGYYRRFIKNYATIASPLTDLLRKEAFTWSETADSAFSKLKEAITSAPVLSLLDFNQPFTLETDASGLGVGAVLSQQGHPIAYFSKKMGPRMQKQSAYTRELFAIMEALAKFRHYLLGHKFIIRTDQKSLHVPHT